MKSLRLNLSGIEKSQVLVGPLREAFQQLPQLAHALYVVDNKVSDLALPSPSLKLFFTGGEESKTLQSVEALYRHFMDGEIHRDSWIVAVGGGALLDLVGFAASTYLRGVPLIYLPTTLLSQVDSSIGGKNGVNFQGCKNQIGTIYQPRFVLCDPEISAKLSPELFSQGMAEVVKGALVADSKLFELLEKSSAKLVERDLVLLQEIVLRAIEVKLEIVAEDEQDCHARAKLNFGHTVGHAIESFFQLSHGDAVAIGMSYELQALSERSALAKNEINRALNVLTDFQLPVTAPRKLDPEEFEAFFELIVRDKKVSAVGINLPVLRRIGFSEVITLEMDELRQLIRPYLI